MTDESAKALNAHVWARHDDDWYVEPDWVDDAIFHQEQFRGGVHDPSCGSGRIVRAARRAGYQASGADIVRRSEECGQVVSFLDTDGLVDNIVANPPFKIAEAFISHALNVTRRKIVMILPGRFIFGEERSHWLEKTPLRRVLTIVPRPSMPPGTVLAAGGKPGGGKQDFVVCVWLQEYDGAPEFGWLRRPPANDNAPAAGCAA